MSNTDDLTRLKMLITKYKGQLQCSTCCELFREYLIGRLKEEFSKYQDGQNEIWSIICSFDNWCSNH